jgi:hypothetical protein
VDLRCVGGCKPVDDRAYVRLVADAGLDRCGDAVDVCAGVFSFVVFAAAQRVVNGIFERHEQGADLLHFHYMPLRMALAMSKTLASRNYLMPVPSPMPAGVFNQVNDTDDTNVCKNHSFSGIKYET